MGVMSCSRVGCDHIMCDMHSNTYGYICTECFGEMVDSGMLIKDFMATDKREVKDPASDTYYEDEFKYIIS